MNKLTFGEKLRQLREEQDLSLRELAFQIGVSAAFLSDVELGRRFPSDEKLALLAKKLNASVEELRQFDFRDEAENIRACLFARWCQENFFKYMREHYHLDRSPHRIRLRADS